LPLACGTPCHSIVVSPFTHRAIATTTNCHHKPLHAITTTLPSPPLYMCHENFHNHSHHHPLTGHHQPRPHLPRLPLTRRHRHNYTRCTHTHTHTHTHTARSARAELWRAQDCAAGKSIWPHWSSVIRQLCRPASQGTRRNNKGRPPETSPSKTSGKHGAATQACSRVLHSAREQSIAE
jgi:hypothetical protein